MMANVIPWGSPNLDALLDPLNRFDEELFDRVLKFSGQHLDRLVCTLNPRLVLVPRSFVEHKLIRETPHPLAVAAKSHVKGKPWVVGATRTGRARTLRWYQSFLQHPDGRRTTLLFVPHPAALRVSAGHLEGFKESVAATLGSALS